MSDPTTPTAATAAPAAPQLPPMPVPEGEFRGVKASLERIEAALALALKKILALEAELAAARPLIDQAKAKFVDAKTGKLKLWPFS